MACSPWDWTEMWVLVGAAPGLLWLWWRHIAQRKGPLRGGERNRIAVEYDRAKVDKERDS